MKILHIKCSAGFWGPDRQVLQLTQRLSQAGMSTEMLVLYRRGPAMPHTHPLVTQANQLGVPAVQYPDRGKMALGALMYLRRRLRTDHIAAIHTHDYKGNLLGVLAARGLDVSHVASLRGYTRRTLALRFYRLVDLFVLRFIPHIVTVSDHTRRQLVAAGISPDRIETIHNAIDADAFARAAASSDTAALRRELNLSSTDFVVSIVGRLTPEKGHRDFLEAASETHRSIPQSHFLIVGDGPLTGDLRRQTRALGLDHVIRFPGYRADVAGLMAISNVIVLASRREGLPNVLLEALALGKPAVATQVGGVPEIIRNRETGLLVPARSPKALARAIIELYQRPELAGRLGSSGCRLVEQAFSPQLLTQRWIDYYGRVLDEPALVPGVS